MASYAKSTAGPPAVVIVPAPAVVDVAESAIAPLMEFPHAKKISRPKFCIPLISFELERRRSH